MIQYHDKGSGFPLILIHGLSDDSNLWLPVMPELSKHYRTIALDVRGHGGSSKPDAPYSIPMFAGDLFEFIDKLDISRVNLMGLSMGSAILQQFAVEHPEKIGSLVLLSAFSYADSYCRGNLEKLHNSITAGGLSAFFDEAIKLVVTPAANREAIEQVKKQAVQINSAAAITRAIDACMNFDVRDKIGRITAPTLIISGREDIFTPSYLAEEIHRSIKGSAWVTMEGVGHNLLIPENINPITQIVLRFLQLNQFSIK
jgi:3-oxoadipate enol-lactonase